MKIIKIVIFLVLILSVCSCSKTTPEFSSPDYPIIEKPEDNYQDVSVTENQQATTIYYANKKTKKIHLPSCYYATKMSESNIRIEEDKNVLINEGYTPCGVCKP